MSRAARRLDEARLAMMLLTRLPTGRVAQPIPMAACYWAYPLAGALAGGAAGVVLWGGLVVGLVPFLAALLALGTGILVTGALHEDGLADTADGFGGGREPARKLEIMRDSRIGSYGVLALVLACGLRVAAMAEFPADARIIIWLAVIGAAGRALLPPVMLVLPAARASGMGHAAASGSGTRGALAGLALSAGLALVLLPAAAVVLVAMALAVAATALLARNQIGGFTGDVLGAAQVMSEIAALTVLATVLTIR